MCAAAGSLRFHSSVFAELQSKTIFLSLFFTPVSVGIPSELGRSGSRLLQDAVKTRDAEGGRRPRAAAKEISSDVTG